MSNFSYIDESVNKVKQLEKIIKSGFELTKGFAEDIEENEENRQQIVDIRDMMVEYASIERDVKDTVRATEYAKNAMQRSHTDDR